jgi:hypothetical protein
VIAVADEASVVLFALIIDEIYVNMTITIT